MTSEQLNHKIHVVSQCFQCPKCIPVPLLLSYCVPHTVTGIVAGDKPQQ